jgi:Na+/H+ antiporter NhaC
MSSQNEESTGKTFVKEAAKTAGKVAGTAVAIVGIAVVGDLIFPGLGTAVATIAASTSDV